MILLALLVLGTDPVACLPVPSEVKRYGEEAVLAYQDGLALNDPKAPKLGTAPADSRLLLGKIWAIAGNKQALKGFRVLMDPQFTWSFGGDVDADQAITEWAKDPKRPQAVRAAVAGTCKSTKDSVTCAAKKGPRLVLEKKDGCWRWTAFVEGD
jgi:hypothetical protein